MKRPNVLTSFLGFYSREGKRKFYVAPFLYSCKQQSKVFDGLCRSVLYHLRVFLSTCVVLKYFYFECW